MSNVVEFRVEAVKSSRRQTLEDLVTMSSDILRLVEKGDWNDAVDLQRERRDRMEEWFSTPPKAEEAELIADAIRRILKIDAIVTDLLHGERRELLSSGSRRRAGQSAAKAYLTNSDPV